MTPQRCSSVDEENSVKKARDGLFPGEHMRVLCVHIPPQGRETVQGPVPHAVLERHPDGGPEMSSFLLFCMGGVWTGSPERVYLAQRLQREWTAAWALGRGPGPTPAPPAGRTGPPSSVQGRT